jgi:aminoglycoside 3-N-acetyltransferase I
MQRTSPLPAIRRLGVRDAAVLRAVLDLFGRAFEEPRTYSGNQPDDAYLERLLASETFVALAALEGAQVVGGIAAYLLPKFEQARTEMYLYDLAVEPSHRRRGIATAMIREAQRVAAQRGAWVIFVQADVGDEPAIALYSRLGKREEVLHFDIAPGEEAD